MNSMKSATHFKKGNLEWPLSRLTENRLIHFLMCVLFVLVANRVKQGKHVLKGKSLDLRTFRDKLGLAPLEQYNQRNQVADEIPTQVTLNEPIRVEYLRLFPEAKLRIANALKEEINETVNWDSEFPNRLWLSRSKVGRYSNLPHDNWKKVVDITLREILSEIKLKKRECVRDQSTWTRISREILRLKKENPTTAILTQTRNYVIHVVGYDANVKKVYSEVEKICVQLEQGPAKLIEFKSGLHKAVFKKTNMVNHWRSKYPGLTVDILDNCIKLQGPTEASIDVQRNVSDFFKNIVEEQITVSDGGSHVLSMLRRHEHNSIDAFIESPKKEVALQVSDKIITVVGTRADAGELINIIKLSHKESTFDLSKDQRTAFRQGNFQDFVKEQSRKHKEILHIELFNNNSKINIVALSEHFDEIRKGIVNWLKTNSIGTGLLELDVDVLNIINQGMHDEIRAIETELSQYSIRIEACNGEVPGFQVSGTEEGILQANRRLKKLVAELVVEDHTIYNPGMPYYFKCHKDGIYRILHWQKEFNVIIRPEETKTDNRRGEVFIFNENSVSSNPAPNTTVTLGKGENE